MADGEGATAAGYVRVYADAAGETHLEDVPVAIRTVELFPGRPAVEVSEDLPVSSLSFVRRSAELARDAGWHPAPSPRFVLFGGDVEIEVSDGTRRRVAAGTPCLFDDSGSRGHCTHFLEPRAYLSLHLRLDGR